MTPANGFAEMKDSGIEWIGEIPAHWEICKIKYVVTQETLRAENNDGYIGLENVESWSGKIIDKHDENVVIEGASLAVSPNDILFGKLRPYLAKCVIAEKSGCCSTEFIVMRPHSIEGRFLKYVMLTPQFIDMVNMSTYGAKMPRANWDFIENALLAMPSRDEQATIAAHLDTQCAKIDEIIAQAKASIEDYKQWKASTIYEAVTKGLDPNVEMKDSGIEWIGRMPAHWTAPALKHLCTMQAGKNLISEQISTSGRYPVYGGNGQRGYYSDYNVNGNFLLVGRQGALCGNVHCVSGKFWATEHAVVTTPSKITNISYLYYLLIAMDLNQYASNSAAQPGLSVGNILTVKTLLPPIDEQVRISEFLDNCCPRIDEVITEKQSLIDDLESYKKSLIYEVVTGKRRVC